LPDITTAPRSLHGHVDAGDAGFSPDANGIDNTNALQRAVDRGGTITVTRPGVYKVAGTVYIGSNTSLIFDNDVYLKKVDERGPFCHVFLNKGALTRSYDQNITVDGLHIIVNGIDVRKWDVFGLHGQIAFFYIKDLRITRFRCLDLGPRQYAIHICTFEDIIVNDVIIAGDKDGVHLGRGKRFTISNGVFRTYDDAVALNAQDYDVGNPEMGWIEDGIVEKCFDLPDGKKPIGFFCRIVAGAWIDWQPGMSVQKSDTVVSNGRLYRVQADPDGRAYTSLTPPTHASGSMTLDGITWGANQSEITYTAGVRNVVFRDIFIEKPRIAFSVHLANDKYDRSYYPGAEIPKQEQLSFDNIRVKHEQRIPLVEVVSPLDVLTIANSSLRDNRIAFRSNSAVPDYLPTTVNMVGCVFGHKGTMDLVTNSVDNKQIVVKTAASVELHDGFAATVVAGNGAVSIQSDLTGLRASKGSQ